MKNKLRFLSELILMFTFVLLCGMHSLFAATVTDEMKDSQDSENISVGEPSVVEKASAIPTALPEAAVKETPKSKKIWTSFLKEKFDTSKKTAKQEPSKKATVENTDQGGGGGGGGGGTAGGSATGVPIGGAELRAIQENTGGAVQVPRPATNPAINSGAINPIVRIERPVTVNTNAPAGPPRPERPSANVRPNEDRGIGR